MGVGRDLTAKRSFDTVAKSTVQSQQRGGRKRALVLRCKKLFGGGFWISRKGFQRQRHSDGRWGRGGVGFGGGGGRYRGRGRLFC